MSSHSKMRWHSTPMGWVAGAAGCALLATSAWSLTQGDAPQIRLSLARSSGWLAFLTLALTLCMTPLSRVAARLHPAWARGAAPLRRALGIHCAGLAWMHAAFGSSEGYDGSLAWLVDGAHFRAGLTALLILSVLAWTSFPAAVRALSLRAWKELHRLAYVAFACAAQHTLLSPFAPRRWVLGTIAATLLLGVLRAVTKPARAASQSNATGDSSAPG